MESRSSWINFWDDGDPVSAALHSPAGHRNFVQRVDNVHVASLSFPDPAASHSAYFQNRDVIGYLFRIIFTRALSFKTLPIREGQDRDWRSVFIGPAIDPPGRRRIWVAITLFIPWAALAALAMHFAAPDLAVWAWAITVAAACIVALGYLLNLGSTPSRLPLAKAGNADTGASQAAMRSRGAD
jgi:hypothetical protein